MSQTTAAGARTDGRTNAVTPEFMRMAERAFSDCKRLLEIIDGMVLVCGRTGDALYDFEEQAAAFHAETGWMRPGKDMPMEGGGEDNREARRLKYNAWVQTKIEAGRAALAKTGGEA